MEDRKRPAANSADDLAPPSKRQQVNGSSKSVQDPDDGAWLESFRKDAIYRQMLEYKREKIRLEGRLDDLNQQYEHYDEHLRIVDAWWQQLLQEVQLLAEGTVHIETEIGDLKPSTGLGFQESELFQTHLAEKADAIKSTIEKLFSRLAANKGDVKPEVADLESKLKSLLAKQKEDKVQLENLISKKDELSASLDAAILRAVKAEKKLDRAKSAQVQKMEAVAMFHATSQATPAAEVKREEPSQGNGNDEGLRLKYAEAAAAEAKLKEQLDTAMSEIKALKEETSSLKMRKDSMTDEDFVRTDVYKAFKSQNEDLIKRVNDLEATNRLLRIDAEKLQAERHSFKTQLEADAQSVATELENLIEAKDTDLTRIRTARDELLAELGKRKDAMNQEKSAFENMKEVVGSKEDRIRALEMELERLRPEADVKMSDTDSELESMAVEELRERYRKVTAENHSIKQELPAIETAYKKAMTISQKKVMDQVATEERMAILIQEKSKADQKYFAARKDADIRNNEIKTLRQQNGKSSEIIAALKDHDTQARTLITNLEKQTTDLKQSNVAILEENRGLKTTSAEAVRRAEQVKAQIAELQNMVKSKDSAAVSAKEHANIYQVEMEKLRKRVESLQKESEKWKKKSLSNVSEDEEMMRKFVSCTLCQKNLNEVVLKTCGHVYCKDCAMTRFNNRMRRCPTCNANFGKDDILKIHTWSSE